MKRVCGLDMHKDTIKRAERQKENQFFFAFSSVSIFEQCLKTHLISYSQPSCKKHITLDSVFKEMDLISNDAISWL